MDADGYIWYEGRADDVIIAAGYRIGPFEVESVVPRAPGGARGRGGRLARTSAAATWSRPSSCSSTATSRSDELAEEIKAFVRERLSAYAYPRRIEFVEDLPKTLTGKIRRIELRQREAESAGR